MITAFTKSLRIGFLASVLLFATKGNTQSPLDQYIDSALQHNIVIQQKAISFERANMALEIAKGLYYPTVSFQFGYQTAGGGRDIQLPLGDLLNNVYSTLNQLTGTNNFPQLQNERINFLPKNFYDGKVRTTMPILNPDIKYNKAISEHQVALSELELDIYKRDLIQQVKTAYFNYLSAQQAVRIYEQAGILAEEGRRVNQKLLDNGKGLPAYVLRSNSEIEQVNAQVTTAVQQVENARLYFNFLLNREPSSSIDSLFDDSKEMAKVEQQLAATVQTSLREELRAVERSITINETVNEMNKKVYSPRLNAFLDLGSQAENFKFNTQSRYYLAGLQLEIPIFNGFRNRNKIRQSELDIKTSRLQLELTRQQLQLSGNSSRNNLRAAWQTFQATAKQLEAAASYQRLIERGYREGTNTFIETVDARNQFTQAQLVYSINQYKVFIAAAQFERETASFQITK